MNGMLYSINLIDTHGRYCPVASYYPEQAAQMAEQYKQTYGNVCKITITMEFIRPNP